MAARVAPLRRRPLLRREPLWGDSALTAAGRSWEEVARGTARAIRAATDSASESAAVERYVNAILTDVPVAQQPTLRAQLLPQSRAVLQPEILSLLRTDAQATLRQVRVPVLALFGEKDFQVPAQSNHAAMTAAFV